MSKIEYVDATINPVIGCQKSSPACDHCFAERMAARKLTPAHAAAIGPNGRWNKEFIWQPKQLEKLAHWRKPRRVFIGSMTDLGLIRHGWWRRIWEAMISSPQHTFLILTKRPHFLSIKVHECLRDMLEDAQRFNSDPDNDRVVESIQDVIPPHIWFGVTVEDQQRADERIPDLLQLPAARRFISAEPILGPVDLSMWLPKVNGPRHPDPETDAEVRGDEAEGRRVDESAGLVEGWHRGWSPLSWVIVGGESGPGARPMHPEWARSLRDQCVAARIPYHFKQWGEWAPRGGYGFSDPLPDDHGVRVRLSLDGRHSSSDLPAFGVPGNGSCKGDIWLGRFGKKAAGREFDGRTWDEFPEEATDGQ